VKTEKYFYKMHSLNHITISHVSDVFLNEKKMRIMRNFFALIACIFLMNNLSAQEEARLMRFPAVHGDQVIFTYAGDLYKVSTAGGEAVKLTNDIGFEMFARFSPDGKHIAFSAEYDGNREVYVMPSYGGIPLRLTYTATLGRDDISDRMGPNNLVLTWKDNENIVFRSRKKSFNAFVGQLYTIHINGGMEEEIPVPRGGFCSFSPEGNKFAYNRIFREFRTWKYYMGGMADDVWIYDFDTEELKNITNNKHQDICPMWHKDKIYYISDRDRIMNLFSYDINSGETKKITQFDKYDIKFPSLGDKAIVFENGGFIYLFDLGSQQLRKLSIYINDDLNYARHEMLDASKFIQGIDLAPDAKRLLFSARGDIFTVPAEEGITRNLTQSSGAHDRDARWSPDGKYIAYISDKDGEFELYIQAQDASEEAIKLTANASTYMYTAVWSPDSKKLLWSDKELNLKYININTKKITEVDKAEQWEIRSYTWSHDSKWIAFVRSETDSKSKIYLYSLENKQKYPVTDGWYDVASPEFSSDGKYLFFVSSRDFNPIYSWTEWNHAYADMSKIYFLTLAKDTPSPFEVKNDETQIKEDVELSDDTEKKDKSSSKTKKEDILLKVDIEGISDRIIALPVEQGSYYGIRALKDKLYYVYAKRNHKPALKLFDLKKKEEKSLGEYSSYRISQDEKKMLIRKGSDFYLINTPADKISLKKNVDLSGMQVMVDKKAEWTQIFNEAWRQMRDFFYDPGMHGLNWNMIREKYEVLAEKANHRDDLNYVIGEMIGELNVGHAYVGGGDRPKAKKIQMGLLGAELSKAENGFFRINTILRGENWVENVRSPLTEVGINVKEGDYIIAVNGASVKEMGNMYESLIGLAGKEVELRVNENPTEKGSRIVMVKPIHDESDLYYFNWVQKNIEKVNEASGGQIGYLHIPDMGVSGLNEFVKYFYPQLTKKALIIDVRGNGGGNVSPMIIERLRRELSRAKMARNTAKGTVPAQLHLGPKACLLNEYSASDGDLFPYQFKRHELGKLIGKRSWGGVVGIRGSLNFIDGA
jgi:tricorn protease